MVGKAKNMPQGYTFLGEGDGEGEGGSRARDMTQL